MDQTTTEKSWWEGTLDYVIRSAADSRYRQPQLQAGVSYVMDASGNLVPAGTNYRPAGQVVQQAAANPVILFAGLAIVGLLIYKMVK